MSSSGTVVTNRHVVAGATDVQVTVMATGRSYAAQVVGSSRSTDVALLHLLGAARLTPVHLGSAALAVGDHVIVVGDAGGRADRLTAAPGRVRSLHRRFVAPSGDEPGETLHGVVELTCDVALGDSGGATLDTRGAVLGMTTGMVKYGDEPGGITIPIGSVLQAVHRIERNR